MSIIITKLDGAPLAEVDAGDDDPDAGLYRAIELAGEHGGSVLLEDDEGTCVVHGCGWTEAL